MLVDDEMYDSDRCIECDWGQTRCHCGYINYCKMCGDELDEEGEDAGYHDGC